MTRKGPDGKTAAHGEMRPKGEDKPLRKSLRRGAGPKENKPRQLHPAPHPDDCKAFTKARVAEALPDLLEAFLGQARQGSVPHLKALTALGGLDKPGPAGAPQREPERSLEDTVLDEWVEIGGSRDGDE